jgi:uncharacterized protein (TIGR00251 family)
MTKTINLYVKPNATMDKMIGSKIINNQEYLVVATRAKAIEGQANQAIIALLAKVLNLKKHQIEIISGFKSRYKVIKLDT